MTSSRRKKTKKLFGICGHGDENEEDNVNEREIEAREDGSQYSLTGVFLPSLGATALTNGSRRQQLRRHVIFPYNHNYRSKFSIFASPLHSFYKHSPTTCTFLQRVEKFET